MDKMLEFKALFTDNSLDGADFIEDHGVKLPDVEVNFSVLESELMAFNEAPNNNTTIRTRSTDVVVVKTSYEVLKEYFGRKFEYVTFKGNDGWLEYARRDSGKSN